MAEQDPPEYPYDDWADIYDQVYAYLDHDLGFYVEQAKASGGPVLELGCGTGELWRSNLDVAADVAMKTWRKLPRNVILLGLKALLPPLSPNGIIKPSSVTKYMDFLYNSNPKKWPRSILDPREGVHYTNKYNPSAS